MDALKCQMQSTNSMQEGAVQTVQMPLLRRLRLTIARHMDPRLKHFIKSRLKQFMRWQSRGERPVRVAPEMDSSRAVVSPKSGDGVRVRSLPEIQATLDADGRLKGCKFMPEMAQYCGSTQHVFKPLQRFLNEFDYTVRQSNGLVLLEGLFCQGVAEAGRCDRSCFYFWRVEWLEQLGTAPQ